MAVSKQVFAATPARFLAAMDGEVSVPVPPPQAVLKQVQIYLFGVNVSVQVGSLVYKLYL